MTKRNLSIIPLPGYSPEIGRWLWALEDVRAHLKRTVEGATQAQLDYPPRGSNSIGTLLYHIALIEADWLYVEVKGSDWDPEVKAHFSADVRTDDGRLTPVIGQSVSQHVARLDTVRQAVLSHFQTVSLTEWRRPADLPDYTVTPEWVIYHLIEHEAHHRGQIADLLRILRTQ